MKTQLLALICRCYPVCITARHWPESKFAKMVMEAEKNCPACRAYKVVYGGKGAKNAG